MPVFDHGVGRDFAEEAVRGEEGMNREIKEEIFWVEEERVSSFSCQKLYRRTVK